MGRYRSGQPGQTVNLLASAFGGSNPSRPTILRLRRMSSVAIAQDDIIKRLFAYRLVLRMAGHRTERLKKEYMYYVYVLQSTGKPSIIYRGFTENLQKRIKKHNKGDCVFTKKYRPWTLICYFVFVDKKIALNFEKYLKSGSGKAFLNKHFINRPS